MALHLHDYFRLSQIVHKGIGQSGSVPFSYGQYLRTEQIVDDIPIRLLVQSQSSVGHWFIEKIYGYQNQTINGHCDCPIKIVYNCIGAFTAPKQGKTV
ncbi:DUF4368 domain-containing protein [Sharpea azabuensis]|uniref:DUF4368 domain-containing protein n=1 Tax=Sharpea azabuensis TaxID=322505 RepID=UPI00338F39AA